MASHSYTPGHNRVWINHISRNLGPDEYQSVLNGLMAIRLPTGTNITQVGLVEPLFTSTVRNLTSKTPDRGNSWIWAYSPDRLLLEQWLAIGRAMGMDFLPPLIVNLLKARGQGSLINNLGNAPNERPVSLQLVESRWNRKS